MTICQRCKERQTIKNRSVCWKCEQDLLEAQSTKANKPLKVKVFDGQSYLTEHLDSKRQQDLAQFFKETTRP